MTKDDILFREAEAKIADLERRAQSVLPRDEYDAAALELVRIAATVGLRKEIADLACRSPRQSDEVVARSVVDGGPAFFWEEDWAPLRARLVEGLAKGLAVCAREAE